MITGLANVIVGILAVTVVIILIMVGSFAFFMIVAFCVAAIVATFNAIVDFGVWLSERL